MGLYCSFFLSVEYYTDCIVITKRLNPAPVAAVIKLLYYS